MRSKSKQREAKAKRREYTSARARAEKQGQGFVPPYLKLPKGATMFKPKEGTMLLDILPFEAGKGNPFADEGQLHWERTYNAHRNVGANSDPHLCLRLPKEKPPGKGGRCPICEHRSKMLRSGEEDEDTIKELAPKQRQLFNVIDRKNPDKGVQLWDMSYFLFGKMLDARIRNSDEDDGWDQFFFLEGGCTLKVTFVEKSLGGRSYLEAETIDFRRRREDYDEDILEQVHCLDDCIVALDYDELKAKFLEADEEDEKPSRGKGGKKAKPPEDDEDDADDEDDPDDEEEEAPPPKKSKSKKAPPPEDDEDDDPDDEDDEDDDPDDEDDEDDDPDDEDDEDDDPDDEDDEEEAPPPKSKSKGKSKSKKAPPPEDDEEDWDDDEDEEEEEPPPPRKSKGKTRRK